MFEGPRKGGVEACREDGTKKKKTVVRGKFQYKYLK